MMYNHVILKIWRETILQNKLTRALLVAFRAAIDYSRAIVCCISAQSSPIPIAAYRINTKCILIEKSSFLVLGGQQASRKGSSRSGN